MKRKSNYFPIPHHQRQAASHSLRELHGPDFLTSGEIRYSAHQCQDAVIGTPKGSTMSSRPASIFDPILQPAKLSDLPAHISAFRWVESEVSHTYAEIRRPRTSKRSTRAGTT